MNEIETPRLLVRRWRGDDLDAYARICADPEIMRYVTGVPQTREQSETQIPRFVRHWEERGFGLWAAYDKATGAFIGFIGLLYQKSGPKGTTRPRWAGGSTARSGAEVWPPRVPGRASVTGSKG